VAKFFVLLLDLATEQVDDFLRAVDVALEVIQVGVAVAVFFTGDLGGGDFFQQRCGTADNFLRRESQAIDTGFQVVDVGVELGRQGFQALGRVLREQRVFDAVETGEVFGGHAFFVVIDTGVDRGVEVAEQLGDRFDGLIVHAGRRVELLGGGQVALVDGVGERLGLGDQLADFFGDVDLVVRHRAYQVQRRGSGKRCQRRKGH
jgi:hypothetical protein